MRHRFLVAASAVALLAAAPFAAHAGPISGYPAATTPLSGSETAIGTQSGSTVQITTQSIANIVTAATNTWTGVQTFPAPGASKGSVVLAPGTVSGTPANGSLWTTSGGLFVQTSGATHQLADLDSNTFTGEQTLPASTTSNAGLNLGQGSAPTSPVNGDLWVTAAGLFARAGGVTNGPFIAAGSFATLGANTFTGEQTLPASTTSNAGLNLGQGQGPASPVNGDLWVTSSGVFAEVNGSVASLGVTVPTAAAGGSNTQVQYNCSAVLCGATGFAYSGGASDALTGPDGTTWTTSGVKLGSGSKLDVNGGFIFSNSGALIGLCAGSWVIGPGPNFCSSTGGDNIGIGTIVFNTLTTGNANVAIGSEVMKVATSAASNTCIGFEACHLLTTGGTNQVLGDALISETTGNGNIALGQGALNDQSGASQNIGLGTASGPVITTGSNEICIGQGACSNVTTGAHNIMIGTEGFGIAAGHGNVALGNFVASLTDQNDSITISDGDGNLLLQYLTGNGYAELSHPVKIDGKYLRVAATTVSSLATADASPSDGDRAFVTDATACTFMSAVTGGGSIHCPVHYDGSSSSWKAG